MKNRSSLQHGLIRGIAMLLLIAVAFVGTFTLDRMDSLMAAGPHDTHMSMSMGTRAADHTMSKGPAHSACKIICAGATAAETATMPEAISSLVLTVFAPTPPTQVAGFSPDPSLRPPRTTPIA